MGRRGRRGRKRRVSVRLCNWVPFPVWISVGRTSRHPGMDPADLENGHASLTEELQVWFDSVACVRVQRAQLWTSAPAWHCTLQLA
eukprot:59568-Chlamydomonas_euryale.AAC.1